MRKIAIVGTAFRFPGNLKTEDEFWQFLESQGDALSEIGGERWSVDVFRHPDKNEGGRTYTAAAGMIDDVDRFDAEFFGISPREADQMDPQQRLLLELAWEALENGGQKSESLAGSDCAVYMGVSSTDYALRRMDDVSSIDAYTMTGNTASIISNRLSYIFDLHGPSVSVDTACSSSLVALHHACRSIASGEAQTALAGGVNLLLHPFPYIGFSKASMLSPTGRCHPFDADGDGYARAEGGAVLFLKDLEQAERDGDPIQAVILASGVNCDGKTNGITVPSADGQAELLTKVYAEAGVTADQVDYVEAHGTGTAVGDPIEATAIGRVLGWARKSEGPLRIGSVKSNLGHLEPASGMAGLVKVVLSMKHGALPPSVHYHAPNPNIDFAALNLEVVDELTELKHAGRPLLMGVNSFGFGGANAHVLIEQYQARNDGLVSMPVQHKLPPLLLSAKNETALRELAGRYAFLLQGADKGAYYDIAHTVATRRDRLSCRLAAFGTDVAAITTDLNDFAGERDADAVASVDSHNEQAGLTLVYSGNGAQWLGMGRELLAQEPVFAQAVKEVDALLSKRADFSVLEALAATEEDSRLEQTEVAQPLLFAVQVGITRLLRSYGLKADRALGHSVGEVAAAWAMGVLTLEQAVLVIHERSLAQSCTKGSGRMAAVGMSVPDVEAVIAGLGLEASIEVAAYNSPNACTLSGSYEALLRLGREMETRGLFYRILDLDYAFHSSQMNPIRGRLMSSLSGLKPAAGNGGFISTVTGDHIDGKILTAEYWWQNIRQPVHFEQAVMTAIDDGRHVFLEIGPHPILRTYINEILRSNEVEGQAVVTMTRDVSGRSQVLAGLFTCHLFGCPLEDGKLFPVPGRFARLPNYPWQRETHWYPKTSEAYGLFERSKQHPLLGYALKEQEGLWENHLDTQVLPYLKGHVVGGVAVLPAAAYVEMAIAAAKVTHGHASHELAELEIHAPIVLDGEGAKTVRFELSPQSGDFRIRSKTRLSDDPWTLNVVGRLLGKPLGRLPAALDVPALSQGTLIEGGQHYELARAVGLDYQGAFQGISRVWSDERQAFAQLVPLETLDRDALGYLLHPGVLDASFQSLVDIFIHRAGNKRSAMIPIQLGRVCVFGDCRKITYCRARVVRQSARSVLADFHLADETGNVQAVLENCRFRDMQFVRPEHDAARQWHNTARLSPAPGATRISCLPAPDTLTESLQQDLREQEAGLQRSTYYSQVQPLIDALVAAFCVEALRRLVADGTYRDLDDLIEVMRNSEDAGLQFDWLLQLLQEEGYVRQQDGQWVWGELDDLPEAEVIWLTLLGEFPACLPELTLAARVGSHLADLLQGGMDRVSLIASLRNSAAMDQYYGDSLTFRAANFALEQLLHRILADHPGNRRLRILEVGVGSGALSRHLLPLMSANHCDYVLADKRENALSGAEAEFAHLPFVKVCPFDPEQGLDPAEGISAGGFDLVIANHLLPGLDRPDLAFENLRECLAEDGLMVLFDQPPDRLMDLVFGADDAWWTRRGGWDNPVSSLITQSQCRQLLEEAGFEDIQSVEEAEAGDAGSALLMLARQPEAPPVAAGKPQAQTWGLICDRHDASCELGRVVAEQLQASGQQVVKIQAAQHYSKRSDASFHADLDSKEGMAELLLGLDAAGLHCDQLVYLRGLTPPDDHTDDDMPVSYTCLGVLHLVQALAESQVGEGPRLWLVAAGAAPVVGDVSVAYRPRFQPEQATLWGLGRVIQNEHPDLNCRLIDLQLPPGGEQAVTALVDELLLGSDEDEVMLSKQGRHVVRLATHKPSPAAVEGQDAVTDFCLDFSAPGLLKHLYWRPLAEKVLGADEVEIRPMAAGLNFRDVMFAMGLLSDEAVENGFAGATLGMELSGVVTRVGEAVDHLAPGEPVIAFAPACFSSRVVTKAHSVAPKPEQWSHQEAATVPTVFFTVYYGLQYLARVQPGERVLIHGAAGGVGIAAIQLARYLGAEIFATAGSDEKRDFVRLLGADHVMDSRSLAFADQVMELTDGEGVDVVVNSLAGEAINRNLRILRPFGRFLELGKRDFYENTKIGLRPFKDNITYFGIDADQLLIERPQLANQLFREMMALFADGTLRPLPFRAFPASRIQDAFRYMQQSRQIGKIVVSLDGEAPVVARTEGAKERLELPAETSYLITGGLSGFGLQTARWLAAKGARNLVLVNRSGTVSDEAAAVLAELEAEDVTVMPAACDVTDAAQLRKLLGQIQAELPPLKGVVHAAMVLDDGLITSLDSERFNRAWAPKVMGTWNLHRQTHDLPLDLFVLFSSGTTLLGNPGQANYVAGNMFLESLALQRRQTGLPATAVCWGGIDDVGYLARNEDVKDLLQSRMGGVPLTASTALDTLEGLLLRDESGVAVMDFDWRSLQRFLPAANAPKYDSLRHQYGDLAGESDQGEDIHALIAGCSEAEAAEIIAGLVAHEVAGILRLPVEKIDPKRSLYDLGMDSLMGVELMMGIEERFGISIPMMALSGGPTITRISERLVAQLLSGPEASTVSAEEKEIRETLTSLAEQHAEEVLPDELASLTEEVQQSAGKQGRLIND